MNQLQYVCKLTAENEKYTKNVIELLQSGATIPFISRYRKEVSGGMDEVQIANIRDFAQKFNDIIARQKTIINAIEEQKKLTTDLKDKIEQTFDSNELEDIYLPYKQKRLTKGEKAKKAGLEPLAKMIMSQRGGDPETMSEKYLNDEFPTEKEAIQGAKDIIAEWINENTILRQKLRYLFQKKARLTTKVNKGKEQEGQNYKDYFSLDEPVSRISSHRFLAVMRAGREGIIAVKTRPNSDEALEIIERVFVKSNDECSKIVAEACSESYKRLILPSLENELQNELKLKADTEAIKIFAVNLKQLLLAPPIGSKRVLAIDPGFRSGCKVVCLDENGNLLHNTTIFPHEPKNDKAGSKSKLFQLVQAYKIDAIAIGDGTAGRETEHLVKHSNFDRDIEVYVVNENGASIYSASAIARKEFPDHDVTVRGSVSIGRRLMDPLAELVKIDAKSIGVGQYQHDVDQAQLKMSLDDVVISSVNAVGVNLNTASPYLLSYVSGLGPTLAENIVAHRSENGAFTDRSSLKKVKRLGEKAYEQAVGFLRVDNPDNPLDNSAVHPESYQSIEKLCKKLKIKTKELIGNKEIIEKLTLQDFDGIDNYTFQDLISELKKPGRDPRKKAKILEFDHRIKSIGDLHIGMKVNGIVTNVTAFGAFVNIGLKENGLIHKSQLSDQFVSDPAQHISLQEHVFVEILEIDMDRKRIALKKLSDTIQ